MDLTNKSDLVDAADHPRFGPAHSAAYRRTLEAALGAYKAGVLYEFRNESEAFLQLLQLTVDEAETIARSTPYAHLLLPTLVEERTQSLRQWAGHHQISPGLQPGPVTVSIRT